MKHSWSWKHRQIEDGQVDPRVSGPIPAGTTDPAANWSASPETDVSRSEASEKLVGAVQGGIRSVMDTMLRIEKVFQEERTQLERRRAEEFRARNMPEAPMPRPTVPRPTVPVADRQVQTDVTPSMPRPADAKPLQNDAALSQILVALEKINAKLDSPKPESKDNGPRLV